LTNFYFKSYDTIIGEASNVCELKIEMRRLSEEFPKAIEYHLHEGHIVQWLICIGETELAEKLRGVRTINEAQNILEKHMEKVVIIQRMTHGRMH
jgi:hypothetical protein